MMRRFISFFLCVGCFCLLSAKSIVLDGIKYTLQKDNGLSCKADNKNELKDVVIPSYVTIDGFEYPVTQVESRGFEGCKNLETIELPNTINTIEAHAFWNCGNLRSIIMPDEANVKIYRGSYGNGDKGIFSNCKKLVQMRGQTVFYPHYMLYEALYNCDEVPFYKTIQEMGASNMVDMQLSRSFKDFASDKIKAPVEKWQRRKEYETMAQWESRVTEANRKKMIDEAIGEAREEYVKIFSPSVIKGRLEDYDSEYGFFPVEIDSFGTIYAAVPNDKADEFKNNWNKVNMVPTYGIIDGELGILSCKFILADETFLSYNTTSEDDLSELILNITPISALKEYEQMLASGQTSGETKKYYEADMIDINIPTTDVKADKTFAVIIGNENYQRVAHVDYAMNDARIFAKYCNRTLGIPESNIRTYYDATYGDILAAMEDIKNISDAFDGDIKVIFYYAGHGLPDEATRNAYLVPIDANGTQIEACYPLSTLYEQLGALKAESVVGFIDACFSGSLRGEGMLASTRGIRLKPKEIPAEGNLVVLSAASANQSAFPYPEKNHGLFSYYLIKKLNETEGKVKLGDLSEYVISEVSRQSVVENQKPQTPSVKLSDNLSTTWRDISL